MGKDYSLFFLKNGLNFVTHYTPPEQLDQIEALLHALATPLPDPMLFLRAKKRSHDGAASTRGGDDFAVKKEDRAFTSAFFAKAAEERAAEAPQPPRAAGVLNKSAVDSNCIKGSKVS